MSGGSAGTTAAVISGSSKLQLTAAWTGQNHRHVALLCVTQAIVPASRCEHYANMVSLLRLSGLKRGIPLSSQGWRAYDIDLEADVRLATGFINSFSRSFALQSTTNDQQ
jgi:hypothetical protein